MTRFTTTVRTDDVMHTDAQTVWTAMQDPDLLASLAPAIAAITPLDGDRWCWQMVGISAMGVSVAPSFTERMVFDEEAMRIDFEHAPSGSKEAAGAKGTWLAQDVDGGAYVGIELIAHVDLPLPKMAKGAVTSVMDRTIVAGGQRFARNLMEHLGVKSNRGMEVVPNGRAWPRIDSTDRAER